MTLTPTRQVMLLTAPTSYRAQAFLKAAHRLRLGVVQVVDRPHELSEWRSNLTTLDFRDLEGSRSWIAGYHADQPLAAILAVDDAATELAAMASEALGLPANDPRAAHAARDKFVMRSMMREGGAQVPKFELVQLDADFEEVAQQLEYPVVVKPRLLTGSRGVIRADDAPEFVAAAQRSAAIVMASGEGESQTLLVEEYLPGDEVAVEGILTDGELTILAVFDKPDPLVGPFFEETIYVTPSRLPDKVQSAIAEETQRAARAIGLRHGPVHAELRISDERPWLLEVAGRSIGGL